jgi:hypothetical protein
MTLEERITKLEQDLTELEDTCQVAWAVFQRIAKVLLHRGIEDFHNLPKDNHD